MALPGRKKSAQAHPPGAESGAEFAGWRRVSHKIHKNEKPQFIPIKVLGAGCNEPLAN